MALYAGYGNNILLHGAARHHQGLDNRLIAPALVLHAQSKDIDRRSRLGGMLNFHQRAAA
jgi:hypothetical protein